MHRPLATALVGAVVAIFGANASATAGEFTLGDLEKMCTAADEASKNGCTFYIFGVSQAASLGKRPPDANAWPCIPEGVSSTAMEFVVKSAMGQDLMFFPKDREIPAVSFVIAAMGKQYPCH